jgi:hypothetical protein
MFAKLLLSAALLSAVCNAQQQEQQGQQPTVVRFSIETASFPKEYAFELTLRAGISVVDYTGPRAAASIDLGNQIRSASRGGRFDSGPQKFTVNLRPQQNDYLYRHFAEEPHSWQISYNDDKPSITGSPQKAEFAFSAEPPQGSQVIQRHLKFIGELTLMIDGEVKASLPINHLYGYSPETEYVLRLVNKGVKRGKASIGIEFLPKYLSAIVKGEPLEISIDSKQVENTIKKR